MITANFRHNQGLPALQRRRAMHPQARPLSTRLPFGRKTERFARRLTSQ